MATIKPITIDQGATWKLSLKYYTVTGGTKTPVDLTAEGFAVKMQIRRSPSDQQTLCEIDSEQIGGIALGSGGTIDLAISADLSAAIPAGKAVYDILLTKPDGTKVRVLEGTVESRARTTR